MLVKKLSVGLRDFHQIARFEINGGVPTSVTFSPAINNLMLSPSGLTYFVTADVATLSDGIYTLTEVSLEDTVGNSVSQMGPPSPSFTVDTGSPQSQIVSVSLDTPASRQISAVRSGDSKQLMIRAALSLAENASGPLFVFVITRATPPS